MRLRICGFLAVMSVVFASPGTQALEFVAWSSISSGSLTGTTVSLSLTESGSAQLVTSNLTGSDFVPAGSANQSSIEYGGSGWTLTFSQAVSDVGIYLVNWRGANVTGVSDYVFDQAPSIESGLSGASISGNTFQASSGFNNGILHFPGPITTLVLSPPLGTVGIAGMAVAINVPEPSTLVLGTIATCTVGFVARGRKARPIGPLAN